MEYDEQGRAIVEFNPELDQEDYGAEESDIEAQLRKALTWTVCLLNNFDMTDASQLIAHECMNRDIRPWMGTKITNHIAENHPEIDLENDAETF